MSQIWKPKYANITLDLINYHGSIITDVGYNWCYATYGIQKSKQILNITIVIVIVLSIF